MAAFLKFVSGVYLIIVWLCVAIVFLAPVAPLTADANFAKVVAVLAGIIATVPAAARPDNPWLAVVASRAGSLHP